MFEVLSRTPHTLTNSILCFVWQMTGLLQALDEIKGVHLEPRGQGKIDGVLSEYYVSVESLSICEHDIVLFRVHMVEIRAVYYGLGQFQRCPYVGRQLRTHTRSICQLYVWFADSG